MRAYKTKSICFAILIFLTAFGLTGCGKEEVEYDTSEDVATGTDIASINEVEDEFEETISLTDTDIKINAKVDVPENAAYNVYLMDEKLYTEEEIKRIAEEMFEGKVYDICEWPRYMWEPTVNYYAEKLVETTENDEEEVRQSYEYYLRQYENAPDDWIELTDYSGNQFGVKQNGRMYELRISDNRRDIRFFSLDAIASGKEDGLFDEDITYNYRYERGEEIGADEAELQEYMDTAMEYVSRWNGTEDFDIKYKRVITYYDCNRPNKTDSEVFYGYQFILYRYMDGVICDGTVYYPPSTYSDPDTYFNSLEGNMDYLEKITIDISPYMEVMSFSYNGALEPKGIHASNVNIISYENAKQIILEELKENPREDTSIITRYDDDGSLTFNGIVDKYEYMTLEYIRIKNENGESTYTIVPAWCLREYDYKWVKDMSGDMMAGVLVNALDGSIIHAEEDIYEY